ncbi:MAG: hypothetical protein LBV08_09220 [Clostridiales bacterium]|jgi:hypothetical protein|nr:hypothetical protein [Clostridiales bacterium]
MNKKVTMLFFAGILTLLIVSCTAATTDGPTFSATLSNGSQPDDISPTELDVPANTDLAAGLDLKKGFDETQAIFEYTEEEIKAYEEFSKNYDKTVFMNMSPMSIAKIWLQYGIQVDWEADYAMYCEDENLSITKQQFLDLNNKDIATEQSIEGQGMQPLSRRDLALAAFSDLEKGEFIQDSDTEGHILYQDRGRDTWINFKQVTPGIWELVYYPISDPR